MAMQEKHVCEECGRCNNCGYDNWGQHLVLRWCLGLVILFVTLWVGISVGELKGALEAQSDNSWKSPRGGYMMQPMYNDSFYGESF